MIEKDQKAKCVICGSRRKRNLVIDNNVIKCLRCKVIGIDEKDESILDAKKPYRYRNGEIVVVNNERKNLR